MKKKSNPRPRRAWPRPPPPAAPPAPAETMHVITFPKGLGVPVWRKNPPTEPGLYWYALRTDERPGAAILGVLRFCRVWDHDGILVSTAGTGYKPAADFQRWWAGPLLEPIL